MDKKIVIEEDNLFDIGALTDILLRRRKIIIFSTSVIFSIFTINTLNNFFKNPIYEGSFSMLIRDPIDSAPAMNNLSTTVEAKLAANNTISELPTLIQYLKSQYVLNPLAKELGVPIWSLKNNLNILLAGDPPYNARGILRVFYRGKDIVQNQIILEKLSERFIEAAKEQRQLRLRAGLEFLDSEYPIINQKTKSIKSKIEKFRQKNNIIDPVYIAKLQEEKQDKMKFELQKMKANLDRLNEIKKDISSDQISIGGFSKELVDLGIGLGAPEQELIFRYNQLQENLANAQTKYVDNSSVVQNLKQRVKSLAPTIKQKQIEIIDLAIRVNNRKININKKRLEELKSDFKLKPELMNQYEELKRELDLSLDNLKSLMMAKDNFQLQIAQKSLPWRVINDPIVGGSPISPNVSQETIRNLLLALFLSIGLAFLKEFLEKGFTTEGQIEKTSNLFGIPILGSIPFIKEISQIYSLTIKKDDFKDIKEDISGNVFLCSEAFRSLATSIRFTTVRDDSVSSIMVTSTVPSEGKTTITSIIAKTLADLGNKVLLVDGDMRKPSIHKFFKIDNFLGLSNLIIDSKTNLDDVIVESPIPNLEIITAGISPPDPVYLLSSNQMGKVFKSISEMSYDYVIFDAPPAETLADADVLSQYINLNLFVISLNKVQRKSFKKVLNKFSKISNGQIGMVINYLKEEDNLLNSYGYQYRYNNDIYKYYKNGDQDIEPENKTLDVRKFNLKLFKKTIIKYFKKFKNWVDF